MHCAKLVTRLLICVFLTELSFAHQRPALEVEYVEVKNDSIQIGLPTFEGELRVAAAGCFEEPTRNSPILWQGKFTTETIRLDRISPTGRDRFYDRFVLVDPSGDLLGHGRYADRFDGLNAPSHTIPWPKSIKGLQDISNWKDATDLGVAHVTLNMVITQMIRSQKETTDSSDEFCYTVDGFTYAFDEGCVRKYDQDIKSATELGINTIAIILCTARGRSAKDNPMVHPLTDMDGTPTGVVAANTTTAEAERRYRAVIGFFGRRYSREDKRYGLIGGYIFGNEVQSHWFWHNLGEQPPSVVIRQYADQVRLSYCALREHHRDPKVFISLDHHWSSFHKENAKKAMTGRELLDGLANDLRKRGDLPWNVAWHPYPENLFKPAFWNDRTAWYAFDTPRITFKNIEVLPDYLNRDALLYKGKRRSVILSEQGFHAGAGDDGERLQAAAYAASFVQISGIEGIDAYILHRYVDHRGEGGLNLGLRRVGDDRLPAGKKLIYDVFKAAGTDQQPDVFRFALPIVGIDNWSKMLPKPGPFPASRLPGGNASADK